MRRASSRTSHLRRRLALACAAAGAVVVLVAAPAAAHVTVSADDASRGASDAILTFRVPNEDDSAVTTKLDITFPKKHPIASVRPASKPGWTVATKTVTFDPPITTDDGTITQGVGEVIYTATSAASGIPAGGFEAFQILVGPLPDAASVAFPTIQTYSNGKTAAWIEPVSDPSNPPDSPAPVLALAPAGGSGAQTATAGSTGQGARVTAATPDLSGYATSSDAGTAKVLGIAGIVVGVLGLLVGGLALTRSRRTSAGPDGRHLPH